MPLLNRLLQRRNQKTSKAAEKVVASSPTQKGREQSMSAVSQVIHVSMCSNDKNLLPTLPSSQFTLKLANTLKEREESFRLAYQVYLSKGYLEENHQEWMVRPYDADPETVILLVKDQEKKVAGTVTLVFDQNQPLPAAKIYGDEIEEFYQSKKKLVEISRLAISPDYRNAKEILILLFNYLAIYAHQIKGWDYLMIEVNPRHKEYYKKLLHFTERGGLKACPQVSNAPAILLHLPVPYYYGEVNTLKQNMESKSKSLFSNFLPKEQEELAIKYLRHQVQKMTDDEKEYFGLTQYENCVV